jgi:hypothetical protein
LFFNKRFLPFLIIVFSGGMDESDESQRAFQHVPSKESTNGGVKNYASTSDQKIELYNVAEDNASCQQADSNLVLPCCKQSGKDPAPPAIQEGSLDPLPCPPPSKMSEYPNSNINIPLILSFDLFKADNLEYANICGAKFAEIDVINHNQGKKCNRVKIHDDTKVAYTKYVSQRILKKGFKESNEFQP